MTPALWSSGFRPFFLLGAAYGPLLLLVWTPVAGGLIGAPVLWHGHEMLFGFATAFICGFVLTALPSWAGTSEIAGRPLKLLVALWVAGRAGAWLDRALWPGIAGLLDILLFACLAALVLPGLIRAADKRYLALLPILVAFLFSDVHYHLALADGDIADADDALRLAVNALTVLFAVVAGLLTPIFTETALRERGERTAGHRLVSLEIAAIGMAALFAIADWADLSPRLNGTIACAAAAVHLIRLSRWRTLAILRMPLNLAMHIAYLWLIAAMALRGGADLLGIVSRSAWIHAFTVGALGMMMLALLNRVALRHTGRALSLSRLAQAGLAVMAAAGIIRVGAAVFGAGAEWMVASAIAWATPFVLFLYTDGPKLWRPSLPRDQHRNVLR